MCDREEEMELPVLEHRCDECLGEGTVLKYDEKSCYSETCQDCSGTGYIPTRAGDRILDLVRHSLKAIVEPSQP